MLGRACVSAALLGDGLSANDIPRDHAEQPARPEALDDGVMRKLLRYSPEQRRGIRDYFYGRSTVSAVGVLRQRF